ncbi:hypothetical protein Anapl_13080 [Anas platyrhynchos]|uniref:Uncharacterized protein n=1 Tax=Anas platyrhynchos TaxID=8839 RepID=R0L0P8_ANAPL|nr:hypothetical protein Anapl_13080 [Anas platyrhynchos]
MGLERTSWVIRSSPLLLQATVSYNPFNKLIKLNHLLLQKLMLSRINEEVSLHLTDALNVRVGAGLTCGYCTVLLLTVPVPCTARQDQHRASQPALLPSLQHRPGAFTCFPERCFALQRQEHTSESSMSLPGIKLLKSTRGKKNTFATEREHPAARGSRSLCRQKLSDTSNI